MSGFTPLFFWLFIAFELVIKSFSVYYIRVTLLGKKMMEKA